MRFSLAAVALGDLALVGTSTRALADQSPAGPYLGIGWGHFDLKMQTLDDVGTTVNRIAHPGDDSWKVFAGFRASPQLSFEADYINFGRPSDSFTSTSSDGNYRLRLSGFAPSVVGTLPAGPFEVFAKAGYLFYNAKLDVNLNAPGTQIIESSHSRSSFVYGGGIGSTLLSHLNVNAEYDVVGIQNANSSDALWLSTAWRV